LVLIVTSSKIEPKEERSLDIEKEVGLSYNKEEQTCS
jgi:hypothetical protein